MKMFSGTVRSSKIECLYNGLQLSKACPDRPIYILTTGKRYARDKLVFEPESLDSYINDGWYPASRSPYFPLISARPYAGQKRHKTPPARA